MMRQQRSPATAVTCRDDAFGLIPPCARTRPPSLVSRHATAIVHRTFSLLSIRSPGLDDPRKRAYLTIVQRTIIETEGRDE